MLVAACNSSPEGTMLRKLNRTVTVHHGDCLEVMARMEPNSIHAVVTDPPYHLTSIQKRFGAKNAAPAQFGTDGAFARLSRGFMGSKWDGGDIAFRPETWEAVLRVLKPGGYMVAFASTRGYHRMVCAIEDGGFIIHPMLAWVFGSGFPKASSAAKAISRGMMKTAPATPEAARWEGWAYGLQALKPAFEPICLAQKPMEGNGAQNLLKHGVGALNINATRVPAAGRWPANLLHDGSDEVEAAFGGDVVRHADSGTASRFFYTAKADSEDRAGSKHPTVKPLSLMHWLAKLVTPPNGVVLDPFAGSGTTGEAAWLAGFEAVLIEREEESMKDIKRRLGRHKGIIDRPVVRIVR